MIAYLKLALAVINIITRIMDWAEQSHWINEGERRAAARSIKESTDALAQAAGVEKEYMALGEEALAKKIEAEGWYRD